MFKGKSARNAEYQTRSGLTREAGDGRSRVNFSNLNYRVVNAVAEVLSDCKAARHVVSYGQLHALLPKCCQGGALYLMCTFYW